MKPPMSSSSAHSPSSVVGHRHMSVLSILGTRILGVVAVFIALAWATSVQAETVCVPNAKGVPGISGGPDWATALPAPLASPIIDDPRWRGATRQTFPALSAGTAPTASARLIHDGTKLFVQIQVLDDPTPGSVSGSDYRDSVYIGFSNPTYSDVQIIKIGVDGSGGTSIYRWKRTGTTWTGGPGAHPWLTKEIAWSTTSISGLDVDWTVNMEIETGATPGSKFWYAVGLKADLSTPPLTLAWPAAGAFVEPDPPNTGVAATIWGEQFDKIHDSNGDMSSADSVWGDLQTYSGSTVPAVCSGIAIESDSIGTTNSPPYKVINTIANTFRAQLSTVGTAALPPAGTIRGRFRLANWGMTIGVGATWTDIPGGAFSDNRVNDAGGLIQFMCNSGTPCPVLAAGANPDQCLLVELDFATTGPTPTKLVKDSAARNLLFGEASTFEHEAVISLGGLTPTATPQDVYLSVKAHNMPRDVDPQTAPSYDDKENAARLKKDPYLRYWLAELTQLEQAISLGQPVYEVRGYRESAVPGGGKVLVPMVPYGYVIKHDGALFGWDHELTGVDTAVTPIIPGRLYKMSIVPGGEGKIKDKIVALEVPRDTKVCDCPCKDCAKKDHTHHTHKPGTLDHNHTCYCSTPGSSSSRGWSLMLLAAAFVAFAQWRRRRLN